MDLETTHTDHACHPGEVVEAASVLIIKRIKSFSRKESLESGKRRRRRRKGRERKR